MRVREYGESGPRVVVLHGGPAAVGDVAPVAVGLSDSFRVVEPWQRGSGEERLTVARHVEDLSTLISDYCDDAHPALVGHSWGAMLALCYAAAHPIKIGPIVLLGCGTFDAPARHRMKESLAERITERLRADLAAAAASTTDPGDLFVQKYILTRDLSVYDQAEPWSDKEQSEPFDVRAHNEGWEDMMRLQADGTYPQAFTAIKSPVLMLHGAYDPHPGQMIRDSLRPLIPQLEFREWKRCGHSPWLERHVRDDFFSTLKQWLLMKMNTPDMQPSAY